MSGLIHTAVEEVSCEPEPEPKPQQAQPAQIAPFFCELCNVRAFSKKIYENHLEGKKHVRRQQRNGKTFKCDLCQVIANGQTQLETHLNSTRHKEQLARKERLEFMSLSHIKGTWIIIFGVLCVFLNLLILFKMIM